MLMLLLYVTIIIVKVNTRYSTFNATINTTINLSHVLRLLRYLFSRYVCPYNSVELQESMTSCFVHYVLSSTFI